MSFTPVFIAYSHKKAENKDSEKQMSSTQVGRMMNIGAEKVILLYNPAVYAKADIIASYVFRRGIQSADYSFAASIDLMNNVINCLLIIIANWISRKTSETSLW